MDSWDIAAIKVGERFRKDLGDLESLAASMADVGLLHPIVIKPDGTLIAGARRLEAAKRLGWSTIPVTVITHLEDALKVLSAERDENECRLDMNAVDRVALANALVELEGPRAKERQKAGLKRGAVRPGNLPERAEGRVRDKVAAAVGWSGRTYEKAKDVMKAAEEDPERFGPVAEEMNRTGKVEPAYRALSAARARGRPVPEEQRTAREKLKRSKHMGQSFGDAFEAFYREVRKARRERFAGETEQEAAVSSALVCYETAKRPLAEGV